MTSRPKYTKCLLLVVTLVGLASVHGDDDRTIDTNRLRTAERLLAQWRGRASRNPSFDPRQQRMTREAILNAKIAEFQAIVIQQQAHSIILRNSLDARTRTESAREIIELWQSRPRFARVDFVAENRIGELNSDAKEYNDFAVSQLKQWEPWLVGGDVPVIQPIEIGSPHISEDSVGWVVELRNENEMYSFQTIKWLEQMSESVAKNQRDRHAETITYLRGLLAKHPLADEAITLELLERVEQQRRNDKEN